MADKIVVYSTSWCGDCHRLMRELRDHQIPFEERDIEKSQTDYQTMMGYTHGKRVIPTVEINGKILINPNYSQVAEALDLPKGAQPG
jgi:mycoredoxin